MIVRDNGKGRQILILLEEMMKINLKGVIRKITKLIKLTSDS